MTRIKYGIFGCMFLLLFTLAIPATLRKPDYMAAAVSVGTGRPVIIIDPGHGGMDGGAVGVDGIVEKDINLSICMELRDLFLLNGFEVVMTRESDVSIHDPGVKGVRKQKTSDLRNRLAIQSKYPDVIFISIHQNKFGDSRQSGTQVFFGPENPASKELAGVVQQNIVKLLQPDNKRQPKKGQKNLFLIYKAKCPAILVECGFISNPAEARQLTGAEYQTQIAFATMASVLEYLQQKEAAAVLQLYAVPA